MSVVRASTSVRRRAGVVLLFARVGAVATVLVTAGRSLGPGVHFEVEMASTGALRGDSRVRLAGRDVGEVRGIRRERKPDGRRTVVFDLFVAREWAPYVRKNSLVFVSTPSILGEAGLEIGPAQRWIESPTGVQRGEPEEPGPPIADGDRLRGADPPELDRFISNVYASLTGIGLLMREHRGEIDELLTNGDALLGDLSGLPADRGQLGRIRDQLGRAIDDGRALVAALDDAQAIPRVRALAHDLGEIADHVSPDIADLGRKGERIAARLEALRDLFPPERREALERGLEAFRKSTALADAIARDVKKLASRIDRGEGTIGAFAADQEIFDDLHEVHCILKSQPWTLILKPRKGQKTIVRP